MQLLGLLLKLLFIDGRHAMKYRLYLGFILLLLMGCGKSSTTAPSDFAISAPDAATDTFSTLSPQTPGSSVNWSLLFVVRDSSGAPRQGVEVSFLLLNATLYSDSSFSTPVTTPYKVTTNDHGVANAYVKVTSPACSATADVTYTVTLTGMLETTSAQWTDAVTVNTCGT